MKELYTLKINKKEPFEEKVKNEDGTYTVTESFKDVPVEIFLKKPSRRDTEAYSLFYDIQYGKAVADGLQTSATLERAISDGGGVISKQDIEDAVALSKAYDVLYNEILADKLEKRDTTDKEGDLRVLYDLLTEKNRTRDDLYTKTAEYRAQENTLNWCVIHLSYFKNGDKFTEVFPGPSYESKLNNYYDSQDEDDEEAKFLKNVFEKSFMVYYLYVVKKAAETKEGFDELLQDLTN